MTKRKKILILGDVHAYFANLQVLKQAKEFARNFRPDIVVCLGDLFDQKAWSKFVKDPSDDSPEAEWNKAIAQIKEIEKLFPKMVILAGNHDRRYVKKAKEAGIITAMMRPIQEIVNCPGWKWHLGPEPLEIDDILFFHGDELPGGVMAKVKTMGRSCVQGHTHKAEIGYLNLFDTSNFGMDVGCMIDPSLGAFEYASGYLNKVWVGFGYIENGVPHLVPKRK